MQLDWSKMSRPFRQNLLPQNFELPLPLGLLSVV